MLNFGSSFLIPVLDQTSDRIINQDARPASVSRPGFPNRSPVKLPDTTVASTVENQCHAGSSAAAIALVLLTLSGASEQTLAEDRHSPTSRANPEFGALRPIDSDMAAQTSLQFPPQWAREPRTGTVGAPLQFGRFTLTGVSATSTKPRGRDRRSESQPIDRQEAPFPLSRYLLGIRRRFGLSVHPEPIVRVRASYERRAAARRMNARDTEFAAQPVLEQSPELRLESGTDDDSWTKAPLFPGRPNEAAATRTTSSEKRAKDAPNASEVPLERRPERSTNVAPESAKPQVNPLFITRSGGGT